MPTARMITSMSRSSGGMPVKNTELWLQALTTVWQVIFIWSKTIIVNLVTLPYYRFFRQNTLMPILYITKCVQRGDSNLALVTFLRHWRERKLYELRFIQLSCTILAGAVIGCFSWVPAENGYWIGPALWYCALFLAVISILLSSSQAFIFSALNTPTIERHSPGDFRRYLALILAVPPRTLLAWDTSMPEDLKNCVPRWKMVFTWQAPMMLMAYAVACFMAGLMISIFFLTTAGLACVTFVYCSFYAYKFVDLDEFVDADNMELEIVVGPNDNQSSATNVFLGNEI